MTLFVLLKLLTAAASLFIAGAALARDPGFRLNRLMAAALTCTGWWAVCEVIWTLQSDPAKVASLVRLSSLGWLMVGPLFFQIFVEVAGPAHRRLRRMAPAVYGLAAVGVALYIGTPWCLVATVPTAWGWGFEFGALFPLPFFIASVPPTLVILNWRSVYPRRGSGGERQVSLSALVGVTLAVLVASATDAVLPFLGLQVPPLGSTAIAVTSLVVAWHLHQYGYSLLSAGAFAPEILAVLRDGVVLLRSDGRVRDCNESFERLCGASRDELLETKISELLPDVGVARRRESSLPAGATSLNGVANGEGGREAELISRSGEKIPVFVSRPVVCRADDRIAGTALAVRDLREVIDIRQRLITTARLAAVGDLSVGIAEEIARPISAVRTDLERLNEQWRELSKQLQEQTDTEPSLRGILDEGEEVIGDCRYGVERIASIAQGVQDFAATGSSERELIDVRELLDDAIRVAMARARVEIVLKRDFAPVPRILCARQELEQVFLNLLVNALDAVGDGGEGGEGGEVGVSTEQADGWVRVRITDDGPGIAADVLERIFDPFFTTKPVGEGTGLGLAVSYHIVCDHGGEIRVATRTHDGTTFTVELPVPEGC